MDRKWKKTIVSKVDLDTIGCAYLCGISRKDTVEVLRNGVASETDLVDPEVLCIEVGGSGRVEENNFDHHEIGGPEICATKQAWNRSIVQERCGELLPRTSVMVNYINTLDTLGPQALRSFAEGGFPYLSDVIAGMLLTERDPREQLYKGVEILEEVIRTGQSPVGTIQGFDVYSEAKLENRRRIVKALEKAKWTSTKSGKKLAYLETDFFGAPGVLYGHGAEIVAVFSPNFGNPPVPKFTVAGDHIKVDRILLIFNELESGWGGPPTGTIIGSPRAGSKLQFEDIVQIVKNNL